MGDLRNCVLGNRLPLPAWYDTAAVEDFCYALLETLIAELGAPKGTVLTPVVTVYDDGEALVKAVVRAGDEGRIAQASRWVNLHTQPSAEIVGEVAEMATEVTVSGQGGQSDQESPPSDSGRHAVQTTVAAPPISAPCHQRNRWQ